MIFSAKKLFRTCIVLLFVLQAQAWADPGLKGIVISRGYSPILRRDCWAYASYVIANPDPSPRAVRIIIRAENNETAVFEKNITVSAGTSMKGRELLACDGAEVFTVDLYRRDVKLGSRKVYVKLDSSTASPGPLFLINNGTSFTGISQLKKIRSLITPPKVIARCSAENAPHHWHGYGRAMAVLMAYPDFSEMSSMQFRALKQFVYRGGTVLFLTPECTLAAADTPLEEILPVIPMRIRKIEELPELEKWASDESEKTAPPMTFSSRDGVSFLESVPLRDGITTLSHGDFPVFCWRRCGFGTVGIAAVSPGTAPMEKSGCSVPVWNHLLSWCSPPFVASRQNDSHELRELLAQLTGYRIPDVRMIGGILGAYLLVLMLVLTLGFRLKRHAAAWTLAALVGLVATSGIFVCAYGSHAKQAERAASIVDVRFTTPVSRTSHAAFSLFSKKNIRPTLEGNSPEQILRPLPSSRSRQGFRLRGPPPLRVRKRGDLWTLPELNVPALKPRIAMSVEDLDPDPVGELPCLLTVKADPTIAPWPLPQWLNRRSTEGWIVMENGISRLDVSNGICAATEDSELLEFNVASRQVVTLLQSGHFPAPSLVLLSRIQPDAPWVQRGLDDFAKQGCALEFVPLEQEIPEGEVIIPPERIELYPADDTSRVIRHGEQWQETILRRPSRILSLEAVMPPIFADIRPSEVEIELDIVNAGENIVLNPRLVKGGVARRVKPVDAIESFEEFWENGIPPDNRDSRRYRFTGLEEKDLVEITTGRISIMLKVSQKRLLTDSLSAYRTNRWKFCAARVRVVGRRPESAETGRF